MTVRARTIAIAVAVGLAFALIATLNSGGYRYGAADQAFYIPAIERHLDPALFPRDRGLIDSQSRLFVLDEAIAATSRTFGLGLPLIFAAGYLVTLALLCFALYRLARTFFVTEWAALAFLAASTLRHRIAKTGANTLEGYFHPRQLAFAVGLLAIDAVLRGRAYAAVGLVLAAGLVHPTTGVFFAVWVGVALAVNDARMRPALLGLAAAAGAAGAFFLWRGPLGLQTMDAAWTATLADKDYVFPTAWSAGTWLTNAIYPVVIAGTYVVRRRRGVARPHEGGVVAGCLALVALFAASLPFVAARVALAVQLQVSRVFWMADLLATLYVVWWVCEAVAPAASRKSIRPQLVAALLLVAASIRGWYVLRVEHPERPFAQVSLPGDDWTTASAWLRGTATGAHVLADPGHAWKYGISLRVSAARDVLLEDVKDGSISMYDRGVALRVAERRQAIGDFSQLTAERAQELAARYDLSYVISERPLPLPEAWRNATFHIYRLTPSATP